MADGPGDQAVHAHQGCCRADEKSVVCSGVLYLLTGEQQLHLSRRPAVELWRPQREESHLRLYRNSQEVRSMRAEIPVHDWTVPVSCNPYEEAARQRARDLRTTPEFAQAQRQRKKVEALFAELKSHSQIGLHRLRLRRLKFVREQFFLAATAQNIKRLVRFRNRPTMSPVPATS